MSLLRNRRPGTLRHPDRWPLRWFGSLPFVRPRRIGRLACRQDLHQGRAHAGKVMSEEVRVPIPTMPGGRSCRYVVVWFGELEREEHMNIAILVWEHGIGPDAPVFQKIIDDWSRIQQAFPKSGADGWV